MIIMSASSEATEKIGTLVSREAFSASVSSACSTRGRCDIHIFWFEPFDDVHRYERYETMRRRSPTGTCRVRRKVSTRSTSTACPLSIPSSVERVDVADATHDVYTAMPHHMHAVV